MLGLFCRKIFLSLDSYFSCAVASALQINAGDESGGADALTAQVEVFGGSIGRIGVDGRGLNVDDR
jgi:hypothetical protein